MTPGGARCGKARASWFNGYKEFTFPATWTVGHFPGGIPEGAVIQLDPVLDLSQFDLLSGERVALSYADSGLSTIDDLLLNMHDIKSEI
jgi:hypothetical protein